MNKQTDGQGNSMRWDEKGGEKGSFAQVGHICSTANAHLLICLHCAQKRGQMEPKSLLNCQLFLTEPFSTMKAFLDQFMQTIRIVCFPASFAKL